MITSFYEFYKKIYNEKSRLAAAFTTVQRGKN